MMMNDDDDDDDILLDEHAVSVQLVQCWVIKLSN